MKDLLLKLRACEEAVEWAGDKTAEEVIATCYRGDWLLWLAYHLKVDDRPFTLAKGHCANTVRHLIKDERSIKAVDAAIAYGNGRYLRKSLKMLLMLLMMLMLLLMMLLLLLLMLLLLLLMLLMLIMLLLLLLLLLALMLMLLMLLQNQTN